MSTNPLSVIIVGTGPAGLVCVAQNGIQVRIIEKAEQFHVESRGFGVQFAGILADVQKFTTPIPTLRAYKL